MRFPNHLLHVDFFERTRKGCIEVLQHRLPGELALLNLVEFLLHRGRELDVEDVGEPVHHDPGYRAAQGSRGEAPRLYFNVVAVPQSGDNGAISAWPADTQLLQFLHQARLAVPRRRLGKMLMGHDAPHIHSLLLMKERYRCEFLRILPLLFFLRLAVEDLKAVKLDHRTRGPEQIIPDLEVDGRRIVH